MNVFAAMYTSCSHESAFEVLSLHLSVDGAQAAVNKRARKEAAGYENKLPEWVQFKVEKMKVLP
jgi:hypothetical protein